MIDAQYALMTISTRKDSGGASHFVDAGVSGGIWERERYC